jgi:hypothetical protein
LRKSGIGTLVAEGLARRTLKLLASAVEASLLIAFFPAGPAVWGSFKQSCSFFPQVTRNSSLPRVLRRFRRDQR